MSGERLSTYERCERIRRWMLAVAAEVVQYRTWSDDFAVQRIRELPAEIREAEWFEPIEPAYLTAREMAELGFGVWSSDDPMRLIPLWLLPYLADEFEAGSIGGERRVYRRDDLDDDHRFGCLAYGVHPAPEAVR